MKLDHFGLLVSAWLAWI